MQVSGHNQKAARVNMHKMKKFNSNMQQNLSFTATLKINSKWSWQRAAFRKLIYVELRSARFQAKWSCEEGWFMTMAVSHQRFHCMRPTVTTLDNAQKLCHNTLTLTVDALHSICPLPWISEHKPPNLAKSCWSDHKSFCSYSTKTENHFFGVLHLSPLWTFPWEM